MNDQEVASLFSAIAGHYDRMNHFFSLNRDVYWRRCAANRTGLTEGGSALDVCCGTGLFALELARLAGTAGRITGLDFCPEMLDVAHRNLAKHPQGSAVTLLAGDALAMPFADASFPVVTTAFGLRNLPDVAAGLNEMVRVLEPGGQLVVLELGQPTGTFWGSLYRFYLETLLPRLGNVATADGQHYCWLPESLRRFPAREMLVRMMEEAGLENVECRRLTGGIANVFSGTKTPIFWP